MSQQSFHHKTSTFVIGNFPLSLVFLHTQTHTAVENAIILKIEKLTGLKRSNLLGAMILSIKFPKLEVSRKIWREWTLF